MRWEKVIEHCSWLSGGARSKAASKQLLPDSVWCALIASTHAKHQQYRSTDYRVQPEV